MQADASLKQNCWQINLHIIDKPLFKGASQILNQEKKKQKAFDNWAMETAQTIFTGLREKQGSVITVANVHTTCVS